MRKNWETNGNLEHFIPVGGPGGSYCPACHVYKCTTHIQIKMKARHARAPVASPPDYGTLKAK